MATQLDNATDSTPVRQHSDPRALAPRRAVRHRLPSFSLEEAREAAAYARGSRAASTWRAYETDWRAFETWYQAVKLVNRGDRVGRSRLTAQSVALVIKRLAAKVGLDAERYSGHSLRSGFLTSAVRARASIFKMAAQSRHKSLDGLRAYVRSEEPFKDHPAEGLLQPHPLERPPR